MAFILSFLMMPFLFLRTTASHTLPTGATYYPLTGIRIQEPNLDHFTLQTTSVTAIHHVAANGISLSPASLGYQNINSLIDNAVSYLPIAGALAAPPTIDCPGNLISVTDPGMCTALVNGLSASINDPDGDITNLIWTMSGATNASSPLTGINNLVNFVFNTGITSVTYTVTDAGGLSASCNFTVKVTLGNILANYTFIGATSYPISPNQSASGITCVATSSEPFNILATAGAITGDLAFVTNPVANPAIFMDPSTGTNTRYFQFHLSGDSLYKYSKFKLYVQALRGNSAAQTINFAYSTDPFSYTINGSLTLDASGAFYEKVVDWSTVTRINNRSDLYIRLYASDGTGDPGDGRLFIDNFQVIGVYGPLARPDYTTTPENTPLIVLAQGNDYYGCSGPGPGTPIGLVAPPAKGIAVLNADGTFSYTPNMNVNGSDNFVYQICDASGSCDTGIVYINITPVYNPPTIGCPGNLVSVTPPGACTALVNGLSATINDPDGDITTLIWTMSGATNASSPPTGIHNLANFVFNVGITSVTYTVTDAGGLSASCSFTVTVNDAQLPVITCPANVNTTYGEGLCNAIVAVGTATATDNCAVATITGIRSDLLPLTDPYPSGNTTITWTAMDINGNISNCNQTIRVTLGNILANYSFIGATSYPVSPNQSAIGINCVATSSEPFNIFATGGATTGNQAFVTNPVANPAIFMNPSTGTNTRYFQFHLSGDSLYKYSKFKLYVQALRGNSAAQTINFAYSTDPFSYTVNGSLTLNTSGTLYEKVVDWSTVTRINNRSDLYIRLYASNATGGGDARLFIDNFQVIGVYGPLARPDYATIPENTTVIVPVLDNDYYGCFGPAPVTPIGLVASPTKGIALLNADGTFSYTPFLNVLGPDNFVYQICDASGSCDTGIVYVNINAVYNTPTIACPVDVLTGTDIGLCATLVYDLAATINDLDGDITTLKWTMSGATIASSPVTGINNLSSYRFNFGLTTITYTVTDAHGLSAFCSFTVKVFDSENPSIVCPSDTTITIPDCFTFATGITLVPPRVSDNCGILDLTNNIPLQIPVGNTTVLWTVNDIHGRSSSCEQIVTVNKAPAISITMSSAPVSCFGGNDGTATATVTGGTPKYTYSWNTLPVQTTPTIANLVSGTYIVKVTDFKGCIGTASVKVTEPAAPLSASIINQQNVACFGNSTGSVTVAGSGGTPPYQYSINGGRFRVSGTFSGLPARLYIITIRDAKNCTATIPVTITQPAAALAATITGKVNVKCFGQATGSLTATATGGKSPYTYAWNTIPVQNTATATGLAAGTYTLTVTDVAGCTTVISATVTQPDALVATISNQVNVDCAGNANGSVTVKGSGGTPGYQYSLNGGAFQQGGTFSNLGAGSYTVTVRDFNNCTFNINVKITITGLFQANNDITSTPEDTPVSGNVMTNDIGFCDPPVTVTSNTSSSNGSVVMLSDGSFTYTPDPEYNGTDLFTYTITDSNGDNSTATVFIRIDPVNDPPVTYNESIVVYYNLPKSGNVFLNGDYDPDGTALSVKIPPVINATNGTFTILANGSFVYTPNLNFIGNDTVLVSVCDKGIPLPPACTNDTILIIVLPPNLPPVTVNESINLCQGTGFTGTVGNNGTVFNGDTDPENNLPLTVNTVLVKGPAHGVFVITNPITGTFNYTPYAAYAGPDMIVVSICDSGIPVECSNDSIFIVINPTIPANAGADLLLCNSDVTFLVGNNPAPGTGTWAFISGPVTPVIFPPTGSAAIASGLIASPIQYVFSYTIKNNGCVSTDILRVTNFNTPSPASAGIDQKYCNASGDVTIFLAANAPESGTGQWTQLSGANIAIITDPADPNTSVSGLKSGMYAFQWTISNGICQGSADVVDIYINPPASVYAGADDTICEGSAFILSDATASSSISLRWSSSGTGIFNDPTILNPVYTPSYTDITNGQAVLTLTATGNDPCPAVSDSLVLLISRTPVVYAGTDTTVCQGSSFTIADATALYYSSFAWTSNGKGILSGETTLSPTYIPAQGETGVITLTMTAIGNAPCENYADDILLTIFPSAQASAGPDEAICEGSTFKPDEASASNYITLAWTTSGTGTFDDAASLHPIYSPGINDLNTGSVSLTLTTFGNPPCPSVTDQMTLIFSSYPVTYAGPDAIECQGVPFTVSGASAANYSSVQWTTTGTGILTNATTLTPTYTPGNGENGSIKMIIIVYGNTGCGNVWAFDAMELLINETIHANAGVDITIPPNTTTQLQGTVSGGSGQYQYNWIPANLLTSENTDHPTTLVLNENTQFVLVVSDQVTGCQDTDTVNVFIDTVQHTAPIAVDDYSKSYFNKPITIFILDNDSNYEIGSLIISICGLPANGSLTVNTDGSITYTPYTDFSGDDEFCYTICDDGTPSLCDKAMVFVHVNPKPNIEDIFV